MALDGLNGSGALRAVRVLANGKRRFDPVEKERLIEAAMRAGVSVARLALEHGVNANQLRNWVRLRRGQQVKCASTDVAALETSAFVPVVTAAPVAGQPEAAVRPSSARMQLKASLPNGVRFELEDADEQALCLIIEALGRCCHVPVR